MTPSTQREYIITEAELKEIGDIYIRAVDHPTRTVRDRAYFIGAIRRRSCPPPAPTLSPAIPDDMLHKAYDNGFKDGKKSVEKPCDHCDFQEREDYIHSLETEKAAIVAATKGICEWKEDIEGNYDTSCGGIFVFDCDGPNENNFKFCPFCGKALRSTPSAPEQEDRR